VLADLAAGRAASAERDEQPRAASGLATSGGVLPARMVLAGAATAADTAVLRYLPRARFAG
jgi:hypothetical protein